MVVGLAEGLDAATVSPDGQQVELDVRCAILAQAVSLGAVQRLALSGTQAAHNLLALLLVVAPLGVLAAVVVANTLTPAYQVIVAAALLHLGGAEVPQVVRARQVAVDDDLVQVFAAPLEVVVAHEALASGVGPLQLQRLGVVGLAHGFAPPWRRLLDGYDRGETKDT